VALRGETNEEIVYAVMGTLLELTQQAEALLRILFKEIGIDPAFVAHPEVAKDRRTLGALIKDLRSRTVLDPYFDEDLSSFLRMRNDFVHNVATEDWFDPSTEYGWKSVLAWMLNYGNLLTAMHTVLATCVKASWGEVPTDLLKEFEQLRSDPQWGYTDLAKLITPKNKTEQPPERDK
jgi:hypothetical protein